MDSVNSLQSLDLNNSFRNEIFDYKISDEEVECAITFFCTTIVCK